MLESKNYENSCSLKNSSLSTLSIYLVIFILLICSRLFDIFTTYLATPDLSKESNFVVKHLGFGWLELIAMNILIILVFFYLFRFSWSTFITRYPIKRRYEIHFPCEFQNDVINPEISKHKISYLKSRNIPLEIGITLPLYVIITGYFQGIVNIMIHLEWIVISFTNFTYLYPLIIGVIFGYISLHLARCFLYFKQPWFIKKAHKIMIPKEPVEDEEFSEKSEYPKKSTSEDEVARSLY